MNKKTPVHRLLYIGASAQVERMETPPKRNRSSGCRCPISVQRIRVKTIDYDGYSNQTIISLAHTCIIVMSAFQSEPELRLCRKSYAMWSNSIRVNFASVLSGRIQRRWFVHCCGIILCETSLLNVGAGEMVNRFGQYFNICAYMGMDSINISVEIDNAPYRKRLK